MGKFTDTKYTNTIDSLVNATKSKLNNPYYKFNDRKPTKVTYYAQNKEMSTLDEASGLYEAHLGSKSPFKFNKISEFILYGLDRIATEYEAGDFGMESAPITGEAIVLPNTINPRPGDFFAIAYTKESILFKVNGVSNDTLDTGANIYKLEYQLEKTDSIEQIEEQVEKRFNFIATNIGTDFKAIVQDCDIELVKHLEMLVENLIIYFDNIFFSNKLQTFVYNHDGWHMYDPYMIEFLIRNKVLSYGDEYRYVAHAKMTHKTFAMDYSKSFFQKLEEGSRASFAHNMYGLVGTAEMISDPNSLFAARLEYYYEIMYADNKPYKTRFAIIPMDVIDHIRNNEMYEKGDKMEIYNLWIAYFNNDRDFIKGNIVDIVKNAEYMNNLNCFYALGISIFIIERMIEQLMAE